MKIFFIGDSPTVDTGFGVVAKNVLTRLRSMGHEIIVLGINEFGDRPRETAKFDMTIYPVDKGSLENLYGVRKAWPIIQYENPDLLFLLNDPWLIQDYIDLKPEGYNPAMKTIGYYPTDAAPIKPVWMKTLNNLDAQICYTKYAESVVIASNEGKRPDNLHQIYHGVDTKSFFPMSTGYARSQIGLADDLFIVGMVARNQPRKRFDILMMAFSQFAKDKDPEKVKLYLHTGLHDVGFDIMDLARQLNIQNKLIITPDITPNQGVTVKQLNFIYNSMDVHALISLGDGFGLPVAESMATGCPQIVSGHSALQELVEDHGGFAVKNVAWMSNASGMNTWGGVSDMEDIKKKIQILYENPEKRISMAEQGYQFITQPQFDWDNVALQFNDVIKKVHHIV